MPAAPGCSLPVAPALEALAASIQACVAEELPAMPSIALVGREVAAVLAQATGPRRDLLLRTLELFEDAAGAVGAAVHERWLHLAVGAVVHERRCALATGTGTAGASGGTVSGDRHLTLSIRNQITVALRIPGIKVKSSVCVRRAL